MHSGKIKEQAISFLQKWWASLLMVPLMIYSLHQVYWAINYNIYFAVNYSYPFPLNIIYLFIDTFLLITHEAGHSFFWLLGFRFLTVLGGSLFQILLPLAILGYCWINRKYIGLQFSFLLLGISWLDVATYAADGGARQLPLIGGLGKESHDWYNLLVQINALEYDLRIGISFIVMGILCYVMALFIPLLYQKNKQVDIELILD
ncbi:hypothetical protein [Fodinibius sp. SL11]|uniref:hypothetical protein n=1 Tax=Fodinibius sp. SL11 TaxID=3425690 RepID=UPI003F884F4F